MVFCNYFFIKNVLIVYFSYSRKIASPLYVPLFIPDEALKSIPPCITFGCEHDVLKNDAQIFHERLRRLDRNTQIHIWEGTLHANLIFSEWI